MEAFPNAGEQVLLVDGETNQDMGQTTRAEMREKNLWHRESYIFVQNNKNQFVIGQRSA